VEFKLVKSEGKWCLRVNERPHIYDRLSDAVNALETFQRNHENDVRGVSSFVVGLHFTSESGEDDYTIGNIYAEDIKRAVWLAQIETAESYGLQYERGHSGAYDSVIWGEDEEHTHWLDTLCFRAAFVYCEKTGAHSVVQHDLDNIEFWGCENGNDL
jgi:hypothetical protein